jgi:hypothetical protein
MYTGMDGGMVVQLDKKQCRYTTSSCKNSNRDARMIILNLVHCVRMKEVITRIMLSQVQHAAPMTCAQRPSKWDLIEKFIKERTVCQKTLSLGSKGKVQKTKSIVHTSHKKSCLRVIERGSPMSITHF